MKPETTEVKNLLREFINNGKETKKIVELALEKEKEKLQNLKDTMPSVISGFEAYSKMMKERKNANGNK